MKTEALLTLQTKGQIMIPKEWRDEHGTKAYQAIKDGNIIILKPIVIASEQDVLKSAKNVIKKNKLLLKSLADK
jgi:bifunctional DNA-binding transcriptional regulator/antitoxin component of YhaV-PrlF toxin-antitoxin module